MTTTIQPCKGRWGFRPCGYALYLKLKRLHKWYWQTVYGFHRWHRWWRKEEQIFVVRVRPPPRALAERQVAGQTTLWG